MQLLLLTLTASSLQLVAGIDVCTKLNYDRGIGKIRKQCLEGETRNAGLCYTDCKPGYNSFVTRCQMQRKDEFPVNCGAAYCAKSKGECAKIVAAISGGAVGGAIVGPIALPLGAVAASPLLGVGLAAGVATGAGEAAVGGLMAAGVPLGATVVGGLAGLSDQCPWA